MAFTLDHPIILLLDCAAAASGACGAEGVEWFHSSFCGCCVLVRFSGRSLAEWFEAAQGESEGFALFVPQALTCTVSSPFSTYQDCQGCRWRSTLE